MSGNTWYALKATRCRCCFPGRAARDSGFAELNLLLNNFSICFTDIWRGRIVRVFKEKYLQVWLYQADPCAEAWYPNHMCW